MTPGCGRCTCGRGGPRDGWREVQLRAQGYLILDEDVARLSPFARDHLNVVGNYTFSLPDLGEAGFRPLRDPDAQDDEMPD